MSQIQRRFDFSGGIQSATTWLLKKSNEVADAINARFDRKIGAATRRLGYTLHSLVIANKLGLGLHESKFSNGAKFLSAHNNSGDSATLIRQWNGSTWASLTLPATIDPNTHVRMIDSIGETYAAGKSTSSGNRMALVNIKNDLTTSATRNLLNAPKAAGIIEYGGALYAINVEVNGTVYSDRAYRSSQAIGAITFVQGVQVPTSTSTIVLKVDSVRYTKTNVPLDFYKAGSETRLQANVTPSVVDKALNTITIAPVTYTLTADSTTDILTIGADLPTGTPFAVINSGGALPTGLTAATTYYWVRSSSTTGKVATTYANATATTPVTVDITANGSGTNTFLQGYSDNDELWGASRKNELAYYWNTDYPTVDTADFLRIPPGLSSDSEITAYGKSNNRLFLYTKSSCVKWDNANLVTVYEDIGCPNMDTLANVGNWMIWVTADNTVQARNDSTGQDQTISEAMRNDYFEVLQTSNLALGTAGAGRNSRKVYKLSVGTVNGVNWRFTYNFKGNNWSRETHQRGMIKHVNSDVSGQMALYFLDDKGNMYQDELGNTDDGVTIPFYLRLGRDNDGSEMWKTWQGFYVYGNNTSGASVKMSTDGGDFKDLGTLKGKLTNPVTPGMNTKLEGRDIDVEITQNSDGDPIEIEGVAGYYDTKADTYDGSQ